jgi:hypothetical protein
MGIMELAVLNGTESFKRKAIAKIERHNSSLNDLTTRFRNALKKSVAGIVEAGQVLIEAKAQLVKHGQFSDWVATELGFGEHKPGKRKASIRKAEMLMQLARHKVISSPRQWGKLPPSPRTLWELTQIRPECRLLKLIEEGKVNPAMTREDAISLRGEAKSQTSACPLHLDDPLTLLVDVSMLLGGGDAVLAHIRRLKRLANAPSDEAVDKAVDWVKRKLARQRGVN